MVISLIVTWVATICSGLSISLCAYGDVKGAHTFSCGNFLIRIDPATVVLCLNKWHGHESSHFAECSRNSIVRSASKAAFTLSTWWKCKRGLSVEIEENITLVIFCWAYDQSSNMAYLLFLQANFKSRRTLCYRNFFIMYTPLYNVKVKSILLVEGLTAAHWAPSLSKWQRILGHPSNLYWLF